MGSFYTSITLKGPAQAQVTEAVVALARTAYVSPTQGGVTVICDKQTESQDDAILTALAAQLAERLECAAWAVLNHDDDILAYWLYERGEQADAYDSTPGYFEGDKDDPAGGDAAALCRAFGAAGQEAEIEAILRAPQSVDDEEDGYLFAVDRHEELAEALKLPIWIVGLGYRYVDQGEVFDVEPEDFTHIGG